jgi:hypothetical protein
LRSSHAADVLNVLVPANRNVCDQYLRFEPSADTHITEAYKVPSLRTPEVGRSVIGALMAPVLHFE